MTLFLFHISYTNTHITENIKVQLIMGLNLKCLENESVGIVSLEKTFEWNTLDWNCRSAYFISQHKVFEATTFCQPRLRTQLLR